MVLCAARQRPWQQTVEIVSTLSLYSNCVRHLQLFAKLFKIVVWCICVIVCAQANAWVLFDKMTWVFKLGFGRSIPQTASRHACCAYLHVLMTDQTPPAREIWTGLHSSQYFSEKGCQDAYFYSNLLLIHSDKNVSTSSSHQTALTHQFSTLDIL